MDTHICSMSLCYAGTACYKRSAAADTYNSAVSHALDDTLTLSHTGKRLAIRLLETRTCTSATKPANDTDISVS